MKFPMGTSFDPILSLISTAVFPVMLFGSKKIADLARGVAEAVKILRSSFSDNKGKNDEDKTA